MSKSLRPHGLHSPWDSPGQDTGVGSRSLLQGIFPTQGWHPGLLHGRWILYQVSCQGSPKVFITVVTMLLLLCVFMFWPWGMWDCSSPTRLQTHSPASEGQVLSIGLRGKFLPCILNPGISLLHPWWFFFFFFFYSCSFIHWLKSGLSTSDGRVSNFSGFCFQFLLRGWKHPGLDYLPVVTLQINASRVLHTFSQHRRKCIWLKKKNASWLQHVSCTEKALIGVIKLPVWAAEFPLPHPSPPSLNY